MSTQRELTERGDKLAEKYGENELKAALKNALIQTDHEERLSLQWALKKKQKDANGYNFTKEQIESSKQRLTV